MPLTFAIGEVGGVSPLWGLVCSVRRARHARANQKKNSGHFRRFWTRLTWLQYTWYRGKMRRKWPTFTASAAIMIRNICTVCTSILNQNYPYISGQSGMPKLRCKDILQDTHTCTCAAAAGPAAARWYSYYCCTILLFTGEHSDKDQNMMCKHSNQDQTWCVNIVIRTKYGV